LATAHNMQSSSVVAVSIVAGVTGWVVGMLKARRRWRAAYFLASTLLSAAELEAAEAKVVVKNLRDRKSSSSSSSTSMRRNNKNGSCFWRGDSAKTLKNVNKNVNVKVVALAEEDAVGDSVEDGLSPREKECGAGGDDNARKGDDDDHYPKKTDDDRRHGPDEHATTTRSNDVTTTTTKPQLAAPVNKDVVSGTGVPDEEGSSTAITNPIWDSAFTARDSEAGVVAARDPEAGVVAALGVLGGGGGEDDGDDKGDMAKVSFKPSADGAGTTVTVVVASVSSRDLVSRLTAAISGAGLEVRSMQVSTRRDGSRLCVFQVTDEHGGPVVSEAQMKSAAQDLRRAATTSMDGIAPSRAIATAGNNLNNNNNKNTAADSVNAYTSYVTSSYDAVRRMRAGSAPARVGSPSSPLFPAAQQQVKCLCSADAAARARRASITAARFTIHADTAAAAVADAAEDSGGPKILQRRRFWSAEDSGTPKILE